MRGNERERECARLKNEMQGSNAVRAGGRAGLRGRGGAASGLCGRARVAQELRQGGDVQQRALVALGGAEEEPGEPEGGEAGRAFQPPWGPLGPVGGQRPIRG